MYSKFAAINAKVLENSYETWEADIEMHDKDLMDWGILAAEQAGVTFAASPHWLDNFKHRNKIVYRARTKLKDRRQREDEGKISTSIETFLAEVRTLLQGEDAIPPELVG